MIFPFVIKNDKACFDPLNVIMRLSNIYSFIKHDKNYKVLKLLYRNLEYDSYNDNFYYVSKYDYVNLSNFEYIKNKFEDMINLTDYTLYDAAKGKPLPHVKFTITRKIRFRTKFKAEKLSGRKIEKYNLKFKEGKLIILLHH